MQLSRTVRTFLALGFSLLFVLLLVAMLLLTRTVFDVWDRLNAAPDWIFFGYGAVFLVFTVGGGLVVWPLLVPRTPSRRPDAATPSLEQAPDQAGLEQRVQQAGAAGIDTQGVQRELLKLRERKAAGHIYVGFFGEISSGKSSLIRALLPGAAVTVSVRGGTTREITEYRWRSPGGDELVLSDMPGTNEVDAGLDRLSRDEALRAHLVIYVCDGDLSRTQFQELQQLVELGKPCILALNKTDRYSQEDLERLSTRLRERLADRSRTQLVRVQAGGSREALRVLPDGREEWVVREQPPRIDALRQALQRCIDEDPRVLEQLRDSAVFLLASRRLDEAQARHRRERAAELVDRYSRRAVLGAMAAVTPGTDLLIQGYLGVRLVRELGALYDVPVRKVDTDLLLELVQQQVGKTLTLTLAVAGNALKAFPGVGTLAGGVLHAVAYGTIFDSLGRALARSLETRGELRPAQTAHLFEENLGENLETSSRRFAKMALELASRRRGTDRDADPRG